MGSIGEEEFVQMVRDYMESSESQTPISLKSSNPNSHSHHPTYLSLQEILGKRTDDELEIHEKMLTYVKSMGSVGDQANNNSKKLVVMKLKMDGYEASLCTTSWISTSSHLKGDYEYIDVMMVGRNGGQTRLIVDMDFRSQFELARPTTTYKQLINSLPLIFVGTEERLNKIISLVCSAAKQSLEEKGLHIPPWRKFTYMQSKWFSKNCKKVSPSYVDLSMDTSEEKSSATTCCFHF